MGYHNKTSKPPAYSYNGPVDKITFAALTMQLFVPLTNLEFTNVHNRLRSEAGPAFVQPDEISTILQNVERDFEKYNVEIIRLETRKMFLASKKERLKAYTAGPVSTCASPLCPHPAPMVPRLCSLELYVGASTFKDVSISVDSGLGF